MLGPECRGSEASTPRINGVTIGSPVMGTTSLLYEVSEHEIERRRPTSVARWKIAAGWMTFDEDGASCGLTHPNNGARRGAADR
jgi:hypothetical protein